MKKNFKGLLFLLIIIATLISLPQKVDAKEDLYISDWVVDAKLFEDGKLQISENITFEFNKSYNGVYREIVLNKTSGISEISVQEVKEDKVQAYERVKEAKNGDLGVYTIEEKNNKLLIKIFSPSKNEVKTFQINYFVNNVAVKYNDTGELYYKFLGDENETAIGSFTVNLYLPKEDTENKVKLYVHGPANGNMSKKSYTYYQIQVQDVPKSTFIEARVLFPTDFIGLSDNIKNIDKYDEIIQEENSYQRTRASNEKKNSTLKKTSQIVNIAGSIIGAVTLVVIMLQSKRRINSSSKYESSRIPQDCTPAIASLITNRLGGNNAVYATILDLFRKGYLRIEGEESSYGGKDNKNYIIYKMKRPDQGLLSHEIYFMNWLFAEMGDGSSVRTEDIKYYSKHNSAKFIGSYSSWKSKVKSDANMQGYYEKNKWAQGTILVVFSIFMLILGVFGLINGSMISFFSIYIAIVSFIYGVYLFLRLSEYGYGEYKKWIGFYNYMKKNHPDLSKEAVIDTLDVSLIYAYGLGLIDKRKLKYGYNQAYTADTWIFWYLLLVSTDDNTFKKSMDDSFQSVYISGDSGSSFSSGGGGGAGGGGAGGF